MNRNEISLRKKKLLDAMRISTKITTDETMTMLGISKSTATRLFIALEEEGKIIRIQVLDLRLAQRRFAGVGGADVADFQDLLSLFHHQSSF